MLNLRHFISSYIDLKEKYVRRFEEFQIVPEIEFHPDARSLLVVGAHADRRRVEKQAREKGLQVIYVDPEGYLNPSGATIPYPPESVQDSDLLPGSCTITCGPQNVNYRIMEFFKDTFEFKRKI